jgi:FkbM family methyltransferase
MIRSLWPWRRNIFLDCGGHDGCSVRRFRRVFDPKERFFIFSFEPNPIFEPNYGSFRKHRLIQAAVHDRDGVADFYLDREDGDGSTIFKSKLTREDGGFGTLDKTSPVQVQTIDLSNWIRVHLRENDHIVLKLDVEGAEYDVLEKMHADGTLGRIKRLFIEWHWQRVGVDKDRHDRVVGLLSRARVGFEEWDAQGHALASQSRM